MNTASQDLVAQITERVVQEVTERLQKAQLSTRGRALVPVGVSVRHVHLSPEHLERLFGTGYQLSKMKQLYQPSDFAADETVMVVGPKQLGLPNVRVLGPCRGKTQVELALSDAIPLGLNPPVRRSGDLAGSSPITLIGPKGSLTLAEGCIRANRHVHLDPETAAALSVRDNQEIVVRVGDKDKKPTVFAGVQVRVSQKFRPELHLDTDDANAADLKCGDLVEVISLNGV